MKLYSPDITKPTEVNYYWHEKVLVEPMPKPKHGEWIITEQDKGHKWTHRKCSVCEKGVIEPLGVSKMCYCPNCGARMKGADNDR